MNDFNEPGFLAPSGLFLGDTKYMVIQGEPGAVIRGKKVTISISYVMITYYTSIHHQIVVNFSFKWRLDIMHSRLQSHVPLPRWAPARELYIYLYSKIQSTFILTFQVWHFSFSICLCDCQGSGGITIKKTNQALIFGIYEEPLTPGQCNMVVERLGDYLVDQGM